MGGGEGGENTGQLKSAVVPAMLPDYSHPKAEEKEVPLITSVSKLNGIAEMMHAWHQLHVRVVLHFFFRRW